MHVWHNASLLPPSLHPSSSLLLFLCLFFYPTSLYYLYPSSSLLPLPTTANNPDLAPVQPINAPTIFFDTQSEYPWEFSLNMSSVVPTNTTPLLHNSTGLVNVVIHGFVLQIIVEYNGTNNTHNHYMVRVQESSSLYILYVY